jgi:hypothetical protein
MTDTQDLDTSADLGAATKGTLHLAGGTANLTISGGSIDTAGDTSSHTTEAQLYHARFRGLIPTITNQNGTVTVRYSTRWHPLAHDRGDGVLELSNRLPWDLRVSDAASNLTATLTGLTLASLTFEDAVSDITLDLPDPVGEVAIRIDGPVRNLQVRRPARVPVGVQIDGGARNIRIDGEEIGATGHGYRTTPAPGSDHYVLVIIGAVDGLTVSH